MKFNHPSILAALIVVSLLPAQVFAGKPIKPPPPPVTAEDVVCDGCVDTTDIEDGAVTEQKLSSGINDLLGTISQLQAQVNNLESEVEILSEKIPSAYVNIYDANNVLIGVSIPKNGDQFKHFSGDGFWVYNRVAGVFMDVVRAGVFEDAALSLRRKHIYFDAHDCEGTGYVDIHDHSGTPNILIGNGIASDGIAPIRIFKTTSNFYHLLPAQFIDMASVRDDGTGVCNSATLSMQSRDAAVVVETTNPLPFSFPLARPIRLDFVDP
jgi:hypothetical protein